MDISGGFYGGATVVVKIFTAWFDQVPGETGFRPRAGVPRGSPSGLVFDLVVERGHPPDFKGAGAGGRPDDDFVTLDFTHQTFTHR